MLKIFDEFETLVVFAFCFFILLLLLMLKYTPESLLHDTSTTHQDLIGPLLYLIHYIGGKWTLYLVLTGGTAFFSYRAYYCYKRDNKKHDK